MDLKAGRGMGLALAAELNGYPGPVHVLELADDLQLTHEQQTRTTQLFEAMKAETIPIGERILAEEISLNRLFAEKGVTQASLDDLTARIGVEQGTLRAAHLRYPAILGPPLVECRIANAVLATQLQRRDARLRACDDQCCGLWGNTPTRVAGEST